MSTIDVEYVSSEAELPSPPASRSLSFTDKIKATSRDFVKAVTTKEGWLGDEHTDYGYLFTPSVPFFSKQSPPIFYGLNSKMPIVLASILGLQHALAMMGGLIGANLLFSQMANLDTSDTTYLVSMSLLGSGILSIIQVLKVKIPWTNYYIGTGLVSVLGVSFATVPVFSTALPQMYANGFCPTAADGTKLACPQAYGAFLATSSLCALFEVLLSFTPQKILLKMFPPIVCGPVVVMIGADLIQSGMTDWAGGAACQSGGLCQFSDAAHAHPWGSGQWIGLGFVVFIAIVICDKWGPPILKSCSIIVGLLVGCIVGASTGYFQHETIDAARGGQFLWLTTFKLQLYGPIVLPLLAVYMVCIMESVGDITATSEVSRLPVEGPEYEHRIQGGVLWSGLASVVGGLMTLCPMASFAQNNGVIAMSQCANRQSGFWACFWLILMGVVGKFSAAIVAIPNPITGGMTTFLFTSVAVSGIRIISTIRFTRRDRVVLTIALMWGFAAMLVPNWFGGVFTYKGDNTAKEGFINAIQIVVETPSAITGFAAVIANFVFPQILDHNDPRGESESDQVVTTERIEAYEQDSEGSPQLVSKE